MIPGSFDYHAPKTIDEAIKLFIENEEGKLTIEKLNKLYQNE